MMAYIFIGDENDISLLTKLGYKDNNLNSNKRIELDEIDGKVVFGAIKTFGKDKVAVSFVNDGRPIEVYRYDGTTNNHFFIRELSDDEALPYIQDLIDENLIRKVDKK